MKKVLFLIHDLSVGGAEKVLVNLVNNMDQTKYDITVMTLFGNGVNEQFLKPHIHLIRCFPRMIRGNSKIMKLFTPEFLHSYFIKDKYDIEISYLEGPCARIISGCPEQSTKLVGWIHVEQHTAQAATRSFRSYKEAAHCYERFDNVICVSEYVRTDFLSIFPNIKKSEVLYNTNETDKILELCKEPVTELDFKTSDIKLIGVGKISKRKGFDKLARIHKRLRDEGYQIHTYLLGVGSDQEEIERYCQENHISDTFIFLGYQTNPYKYVAKSDIFVCASVAEGFSTAATESLIVGTPVVTTRVSGMEEMLGSDNEYGIITDNNEESLYLGIKEMLDHPARLQEYRKISAERGRHFSTTETVNAVEKMLMSL